MSSELTMTTAPDAYGMTAEDWRRLKTRTDDEIMAAALADSDAQPIPPERLAKMGRPLAKVVRHKLKLSLDDFAAAYGIPREVLLAWERNEAMPSTAETTYLQLIEREPELTRRVSAGV